MSAIPLFQDETQSSLSTEAKRVFDSIETPIHIWAIAGSLRLGKSTLLNCFLHCFQEVKHQGFETSNSVHSCTKGIWMWSEPFLLKDGSSVLLLDQEGQHERLGCVTSNFASIFMLNSERCITDSSLQYLELVTGLHHSMDHAPALVWLLRDAGLVIEHEQTKAVLTPTQYLEEALAKETDRNVFLKSMFPTRTCHALSLPCLDPYAARLEWGDLTPQFQNQVRDLFQQVQTLSKPLSVCGIKLNGPNLCALLQVYLQGLHENSHLRVRALREKYTLAIQEEIEKLLRHALVEVMTNAVTKDVFLKQLGETQLEAWKTVESKVLEVTEVALSVPVEDALKYSMDEICKCLTQQSATPCVMHFIRSLWRWFQLQLELWQQRMTSLWKKTNETQVLEWMQEVCKEMVASPKDLTCTSVEEFQDKYFRKFETVCKKQFVAFVHSEDELLTLVQRFWHLQTQQWLVELIQVKSQGTKRSFFTSFGSMFSSESPLKKLVCLFFSLSLFFVIFFLASRRVSFFLSLFWFFLCVCVTRMSEETKLSVEEEAKQMFDCVLETAFPSRVCLTHGLPNAYISWSKQEEEETLRKKGKRTVEQGPSLKFAGTYYCSVCTQEHMPPDVTSVPETHRFPSGSAQRLEEARVFWLALVDTYRQQQEQATIPRELCVLEKMVEHMESLVQKYPKQHDQNQFLLTWFYTTARQKWDQVSSLLDLQKSLKQTPVEEQKDYLSDAKQDGLIAFEVKQVFDAVKGQYLLFGDRILPFHNRPLIQALECLEGLNLMSLEDQQQLDAQSILSDKNAEWFLQFWQEEQYPLTGVRITDFRTFKHYHLPTVNLFWRRIIHNEMPTLPIAGRLTLEYITLESIRAHVQLLGDIAKMPPPPPSKPKVEAVDDRMVQFLIHTIRAQNTLPLEEEAKPKLTRRTTRSTVETEDYTKLSANVQSWSEDERASFSNYIRKHPTTTVDMVRQHMQIQFHKTFTNTNWNKWMKEKVFFS